MNKWVKTVSFLVFIFSFSSHAAPQQSSADQAFPPAMKTETFNDQLFFVTIRIETLTKTGKGVSTAFVVEYPIGGGKRIFFLVANKHAVAGVEAGKFFFMRSDGVNPLLGQRYDINIENFQDSWFGHADPEVDVAVMPLGLVLSEIDRQGWKIFFKSIPLEIFASPADTQSFDSIEDVVFVGYPNGLFDMKNHLPVARRGTAATPLSVDYNGRPEFMIDASVFQGSSGSPVFLAPRSKGASELEGPYFLGMISGSAYRSESGRIDLKEGPSADGPVFEYDQLLNLGIVVKASAIAETIAGWIQQNKASLDEEAERMGASF